MWNILNHNGEFISSQWFGWINEYQNNKLARVALDEDRWNFIDINGELLCPSIWFYWSDMFYKGVAKVQREDFKWSFIDERGNLLFHDMWFDSIVHSFRFRHIWQCDEKAYFMDDKNNVHLKLL